jgi:hypothetical protein
LYSEDNNDEKTHHPAKSGTVFATFTAQKAKKKKHAPKEGIAPAEQHLCVPPCIFAPDKKLDCLTDSHVKFNSLDDTQELLNNSYHKTALKYDQDTMSSVEDSTLITSEVPLSKNSDFSAGNAPIAFEYYCYDIDAGTP